MYAYLLLPNGCFISCFLHICIETSGDGKSFVGIKYNFYLRHHCLFTIYFAPINT